ncbi:hypothetical protein BaRGS_00038914, partial [Batillaria attramentaria]
CNIKALGLWDTQNILLSSSIFVSLSIIDAENGYYGLGNHTENVLVDNQMTITTTDATQSADVAKYARYVKEINIYISLQDNTKDGKIYVPYFTLKYAEVDRVKAEAGETHTCSFVCWLPSVGVVKACWSAAIDFPTIVNFIFYLCASLSNAFFVITFGIAFYWFIFFKRQDVVYLVHPDMSGIRGREWLGLFGSAFALRAMALIHLVIMQCSADIFLIDWERPRGVSRAQDGKKGSEVPVSIWRTYFVANEWNEIQATRKINKVFQIFAVVFFLEVVGFVNTTTKDPDGSVEKDSGSYQAEQSFVYRYALAVMVYLVVGVVQWIFFTFIYERFIEDKVQQFVDLCSMSNISAFIMAHSHFGYYIHGRSVHGKADTNMREMCGDDEEGRGGSVRPARPGAQYRTADIHDVTPKATQGQIRASLFAGSFGERWRLAAGRRRVLRRTNMLNKFLCGFIDHSLRDVDYVVKDKTLLESVMDTEFFDATEKGIFYNGNHQLVLAGIITYIIIELVSMVRTQAARKNLAKKTLVDERFLI